MMSCGGRNGLWETSGSRVKTNREDAEKMKLLLIIVIVAHWLMIVVKGLFMFPLFLHSRTKSLCALSYDLYMLRING